MPKKAALALAVCFAPSLVAQTQPCFELNNVPGGLAPVITLIPFTGINRWAYQIDPATTITARAITMHTENRFSSGFMQLGLWDRDAKTMRPRTELARGSWKVNAARGAAWQGVNLDRPVTLTGGQSYFVVWDEPGGSQVPHAAGGTTTLNYRAVPTAPAGWQRAGMREFKCRVHCNLLDDANVTVAGATCAASGGTDATIFTNEAPRLGNGSFSVEGNGFPPAQITLFLLDVNSLFTPLVFPGFPSGCTLGMLPRVTTITGQSGTGKEPGHVCFAVALRNRPAWTGLVLNFQAGVVDLASGAALPVVLSNRLDCTLF